MKNYLNTVINIFRRKQKSKYDFIYRFSLYGDDEEFMEIRFCDLPYNDLEAEEKLETIGNSIYIDYYFSHEKFSLYFYYPTKALSHILFDPMITYGRYTEKATEYSITSIEGNTAWAKDTETGKLVETVTNFDSTFDTYKEGDIVFIKNMSTKSIQISEDDFKNRISKNIDSIKSENGKYISLFLKDCKILKSESKTKNTCYPKGSYNDALFTW